MKRFISIALLTSIIIFLTFGCATQRYGREQNVTDAEGRFLSCDAIAVEIDKSQQFIKDVNDKDAEFTGKDVLGFLGDFGIGNAMEHTEAIESATKRIDQLKALQVKKGCV